MGSVSRVLRQQQLLPCCSVGFFLLLLNETGCILMKDGVLIGFGVNSCLRFSEWFGCSGFEKPRR